jgi:hypothetical protein
MGGEREEEEEEEEGEGGGRWRGGRCAVDLPVVALHRAKTNQKNITKKCCQKVVNRSVGLRGGRC